MFLPKPTKTRTSDRTRLRHIRHATMDPRGKAAGVLSREGNAEPWRLVVRSLLVVPLLPTLVSAQTSERVSEPGELLSTLVGEGAQGLGVPARLILFVTIFGVVPSIILLTTCFPRILIVLSFLRRALGTQDLPPNQVMAGLALILTMIVMMPVWTRVYREAYLPLSDGTLKTTDEAFEKAALPLKEFMIKHTFEKDLLLFYELSTREEVGDSDGGAASSAKTRSVTSESLARQSVEELSFFVVLPAFVLSELKTAFQMGFLLYLPFLIIDLVVSAVLISMGMFMLPPILISLPVKVMVFVMVDGWNLVVMQLLRGFQGVL